MGYVEGDDMKSQRLIEAVLVNMLAEKRCWADKEDIGLALLAVRRDARAMVDEREHLNGCVGSALTPSKQE